ncbi:transformer-2 protein homolog beta-like [Anopheles nili]|uniref:transformer-2 protein homolog beta-like n=1 Tax=Anopheles nili TaxID=185578 RepID=UPI00237A47D0|nr:transformer-2 protein homolog beta-like [Anopheles nili]
MLRLRATSHNYDRSVKRRYESDRRRSRSVEHHRRSRRSRSDSRDRYRSHSRDRYRHGSRNRSVVRGRVSYRKSPSSSHSRTRIRVDSPEPTRCLGVFGLSVYTTEPYLIDIFCHFGTVEKAIVIYDAKTRLSRGFGFVYFKTEQEATMARMHCNGLEMHGRRIRVDYSITEQPHAPTPGIYMGRKTGSRSLSPRYNSRKEHRRSRRSRSYSHSSYDSR